jgi:hypothetical protein
MPGQGRVSFLAAFVAARPTTLNMLTYVLVLQSRVEGCLLLDPSADEVHREEAGLALAVMPTTGEVRRRSHLCRCICPWGCVSHPFAWVLYGLLGSGGPGSCAFDLLGRV